MKKICKLCYREMEEDMMKGSYCFTCLAIIGKGTGYGNYMSNEEADRWFQGTQERREKFELENSNH